MQDALPAPARRARYLLQALDLGAVRLQVRTNTLAGPEQTDAAIVRIKETGTSVAMSLDGNGRYCYLSPREGAQARRRRMLPQSLGRRRAARSPPPTA